MKKVKNKKDRNEERRNEEDDGKEREGKKKSEGGREKREKKKFRLWLLRRFPSLLSWSEGEETVFWLGHRVDVFPCLCFPTRSLDPTVLWLPAFAPPLF